MAFTYFFRDRRALELVIKHALPTWRGQRYIRIWDAGCAHGPEPYTLAIMLRENMSHFLFRNVRIYCTDIDNAGVFGPTIRQGRFHESELRRIPADLRSRYFRAAERQEWMEVDPTIRSQLVFMQHDLRTLAPIRLGFSLIVCKNVLLHLPAEDQLAVVEMFRSSLREGGFLLTEHTHAMPPQCEDIFERVTSKGQLYRTAAHSSLLRAAA